MRDHDNRPQWPFKHVTKMSAHRRGQWCKKVDGQVRNFGPWAMPDPENRTAKAALDRYMEFIRTKDQGAQPEVVHSHDLTVEVVVNGYLTQRKDDVEKGELSARQFMEYRKMGELLLKVIPRGRLLRDMTPADFARIRSSMKGGPVRQGNQITWMRSFFRWAQEYHGVAVRYGGQFDKPSRKAVRKAARQVELFSAVELKTLLAKASPSMKAFIMLGINGGFGSADIGSLPVSAVDYERGLIDMYRQKTGVRRIVPLWPETIKALQEYTRPHTGHPELFFVTRYGNPITHEKVTTDELGVVKKALHLDGINAEWRRLVKESGVKMRGFYTLRKTFDSVADEEGDVNARRLIMGHSFPGMDEYYVHLTSNLPRLRRVADYVREWLYGPIVKPPTRKSTKNKSIAIGA